VIILRVSSGQANQMYEFAAAYALAKTRREELVLDISACLDSAWGYQLDYFNIPELSKIIYHSRDAEDVSHTSAHNIPPSLLMGGQAYSDVNPALPSYKDITQAEELTGDPIILCGYFFPPRYYQEHWDEIRNMFVPGLALPVLEHFSRFSQGYETVGLHIRRGDFLVTEWAFMPEDGFFRAAVNWYRKKLANPRFFVFSDDIEYAKHILGVDSSIFYMHLLGHNEAPLAEFLGLSRCRHKVLSNDSTFSRLAYELNTDPKKSVVWRSRLELTWRQRIKKMLFKFLKKRAAYELVMDAKDVAHWAKGYVGDGLNPLGNYKVKIQEAVACADDRRALDMIDRLCLNVAELAEDDRQAIAYRKFSAHVRLHEPDRALDLAYPLWFHFDACREFHEQYMNILSEAGFFEEAAVEAARCQAGPLSGRAAFQAWPLQAKTLYDIFSRCGKSRFLLAPYGPMTASSRPLGLVRLGIVLRRLGHEVCLLLKTPAEPGAARAEATYIRSHKMLVTREGVRLGCEQALYEDIAAKQGLENFVRDFAQKSYIPSAIVSRDPALCDAAHRLALPFIYAGFPPDDPESAAGNKIEEPLRSLMGQRAAFVIPAGPAEEKEYRIHSERWTFRREQRLPVREIQRAAALLDGLSNNPQAWLPNKRT